MTKVSATLPDLSRFENIPLITREAIKLAGATVYEDTASQFARCSFFYHLGEHTDEPERRTAKRGKRNRNV